MTLNGIAVFSKRGGTSRFLFRRTDLKWAVGATSKELVENDSKAGVACSGEINLPHPTLAKAWQAFNGLKWYGEEWQSQPMVTSIMASLHSFELLNKNDI